MEEAAENLVKVSALAILVTKVPQHLLPLYLLQKLNELEAVDVQDDPLVVRPSFVREVDLIEVESLVGEVSSHSLDLT